MQISSFLFLDENAPAKTIDTLGQGQEPHASTMNLGGGGGGVGRRTTDANIRILREKCLEYLKIFVRGFNLGFWRNGVVVLRCNCKIFN